MTVRKFEQEETLRILRKAHARLRRVIDSLSADQIDGEVVTEEWTAHDLIAHIAAWIEEYVEEIARILDDRATWHLMGPDGTDRFNREQTAARRSKPLPDLLEEWEESYEALIARVEGLSNNEWRHRSKDDSWSNEFEVTVASLFGYEHKMGGHEAEHAEQIEKHFGVGG